MVHNLWAIGIGLDNLYFRSLLCITSNLGFSNEITVSRYDADITQKLSMPEFDVNLFYELLHKNAN